MKKAGLEKATMLYMRPNAKKLWEKLTDNSHIILVQGPPGTGKSSVVWAWACWCAYESKEKFIWLHYTGCGNGMAVILDEKKVKFREITAQYPLADLLSNIEDCTVIIDGLSTKYKSMVGDASLWRKDPSRLVFVSSYALSLKSTDTTNWMNYIVTSWTFDDYKVACKDAFFILILLRTWLSRRAAWTNWT